MSFNSTREIDNEMSFSSYTETELNSDESESYSEDFGEIATLVRPSISFMDGLNTTGYQQQSVVDSSDVIEDSTDETKNTNIPNVLNQTQDESMIVRPRKSRRARRIIDTEDEEDECERSNSLDVNDQETELNDSNSDSDSEDDINPRRPSQNIPKPLRSTSDADILESSSAEDEEWKSASTTAELIKSVNSDVQSPKHEDDSDDADDVKPRRQSQNIQNVLSSTRIEADSSNNRLSRVFGGKTIKEELLKPEEVYNISSSPSVSYNSAVIDIISDSEDEERIVPKKPNNNLRQPTLDQMFKPRHNNNVSNNSSDASINKSEVSQQEYQFQKEKVKRIRVDFHRLQNLMNTIKLTTLPDKGLQLIQSHKKLMETLAEQEDKLQKMTINVSVSDVSDPLITAPKPATWQELNNIAAAVQPRTLGVQALATHNQQKTVTMDRLHQLHGSLKTCPSEDTYASDPKGLLIELMMHQKHALAWLMWREKQKPSGGILADDMGLGKTLTMISLMMKMNEASDDQNDEENDSDDENEDNENHHKRYKYYGGTLIVCPASLISQWEGEVRNRVRRGLISVELYHGGKRETKSKRLANYDMVITTYSIVMNELDKDSPLYKIKWERIVLDEAHQIRNHKSRTSIAACQLSAKSRWALTGTPIHNKEVDLYSLLKFLRCSPFDDLAIFKRWVSDKNTGGQERLNTVMSSLMLRRTKAQLQMKGSLQSLPERFWEIVEVRLEKEEMDIYQKILLFSKTLFSQFLHQRATKNTNALDRVEIRPNGTSVNDPNGEYHKMHKKLIRLNKMKEVKQHEILVLLLRLRQVCCHPSLITAMLQNGDIESASHTDDIEDVEIDAMNLLDQLNKLNLEDEEEPHSVVIQESVGLAEATRGILKPSNPIFNSRRRSTKVKAVIKLLKEKVVDTGDKCIIVSQWTSFLRLLAIHLEEENIIYDQLDGSVPVIKRAVMIDNFNNPAYRAKILLLSLTAGGVGLNLVGANHLFLLDLHWNPQLEMQAQDRIYRMGQKKPVFVYKFMTMDTIEERIKGLQDHKKNLAESVLTGAKMLQTKLSIDDLKMLFEM